VPSKLVFRIIDGVEGGPAGKGDDTGDRGVEDELLDEVGARKACSTDEGNGNLGGKG